MANSSLNIPKAHLIMALCLPLAVLLGYFLAEPMEPGTLAVVTFVLVILSVPLMMKWHHLLLVISWNAWLAPTFLPGRPYLWMLIAPASLFISILNRSVNPDSRFMSVPTVTRSIFLLLGVVIGTALLKGGIGLRVLGSSQFGGRNYFYVVTAIAGYFAFSTFRIPREKAGLYVALFFLSALTALVGDLFFMMGPRFYAMCSIFPSIFTAEQPNALYAFTPGIGRMSGLPWVAMALYSFLFVKYGIRGTFDSGKPWRFGVLVLAFACSLASGFRSNLITFGLTFLILFFLEGLHRTRFLPAFIGLALLITAGLVPFANKLPWVAQRTLAFLPLHIDPMVKADAVASSDWRLHMWKEALGEIPSHLLLGQGYSMDPDAMYMANVSMTRGFEADYSAALLAGDFHNGPLSVLIPFGLPGAIAFCWFLWAVGQSLYRNYRYGDPGLRQMNTLIFATFLAKALFFFFVFGSLYSDLCAFTGLAGLSLSLNGEQSEVETETEAVEEELEPVY